jgi:hypothetical protein
MRDLYNELMKTIDNYPLKDSISHLNIIDIIITSNDVDAIMTTF